MSSSPTLAAVLLVALASTASAADRPLGAASAARRAQERSGGANPRRTGAPGMVSPFKSAAAPTSPVATAMTPAKSKSKSKAKSKAAVPSTPVPAPTPAPTPVAVASTTGASASSGASAGARTPLQQDAVAARATAAQVADAVVAHEQDLVGLRAASTRAGGDATQAEGEATRAQSAHAGAESTLMTRTQELTRLRDAIGYVQRARQAEGGKRKGITAALARASRAMSRAFYFWAEDADLSDSDLESKEKQLDARIAVLAGPSGEVARLEQDADVRATAALSASQRAQSSRQAARAAAQRLADHQVTLDGLRLQALGATTAADDLESKVKVAEARAVRTRSLEDQHHVAPADKARAQAATRRLGVVAAIHAKPGTEPSEDAVATAPEKGLFAIADGVTNSDFSGDLARILVRRWTTSPPASRPAFDAWLADAQAEWSTATSPRVAELRQAYYNRNKEFVGHAAFVGAGLGRDGSGRRVLRALALGDSAIMIVRKGRLLKAFPRGNASEYTSVVTAVPSTGKALAAPEFLELPIEDGDEVFLATDALSKWTLTEVEAGRDPFTTLRGIDKRPAMAKFVEQARAGLVPGASTMEMDDTALVRFVVPTGATP